MELIGTITTNTYQVATMGDEPVAPILSSDAHRGGGVAVVMSYQEVTGTLSQGAHPGGYNGQDAYSDLLVTEEMYGTHNGERTGECRDYAGVGCCCLNASHEQPILLSDRKGHNGITTDGTATTLTAQEKERPIMSEKGGDAMKSVVRRLTPLE